jgi:hypothetical protein
MRRWHIVDGLYASFVVGMRLRIWRDGEGWMPAASTSRVAAASIPVDARCQDGRNAMAVVVMETKHEVWKHVLWKCFLGLGERSEQPGRLWRPARRSSRTRIKHHWALCVPIFLTSLIQQALFGRRIY